MSRIGLRGACAASALCLLLGACGGGGGGGGSSSSTGSASAGTGTPAAQLAPTRPKSAVVIDREGEGFLERDNGQLILHVKGSNYERGRQYGALVGSQIEILVRGLPAYMDANKLPGAAVAGITTIAAAIFRPYFPSDALDYIRGIVEGNRQRRPSSFLIEDDVVFLNSLIDLGAIVNGIINCSSIALWGNWTVDGKMFQTRNIDLFVGSGLESHALVIMEKGLGEVPFMNCGWTGIVGCASGMNAHGIAIGQVWGFSFDKAFGRPWNMNTRKIMAHGISCEDALVEFQGERHRTYGSNFVFGDKGDTRGGVPAAVAIESSANYIATFRDNDPAENRAIWTDPQGAPHQYSIPVPQCVFRGDSCMDPAMRSRQNASGGPDGDPRAAGAYQDRYKGQYDSWQRHSQGGTIKADAAMVTQISRDVAMRNGSLQCCVYANSDLEAWVANAVTSPLQGAYTQPYYHYDLNYYLPTVRVTLDSATYAAGASQAVTLAWDTLGCDRDLELWLRVEGPGGSYAAESAPVALSYRKTAGTQSKTLRVALPVGLASGQYNVTAILCERGTGDWVDLSVVPFNLQ